MWGISYWIFPIISALCWLGMLLALLIRWTATGEPIYPSMGNGQTIAYISDVGAEGLKPLFIAGSCVTSIFLDLSFLSERWLRHRGRLARNTTATEKVLSSLSLAFALMGTCGLILLGIFDTLRYPRLHDVFLLLFIAGYVISAVFICWEYQRLGIRYRQHAILRYSFWIKLCFIIVEVVLAIAFGSLNFKNKYNAAAVLEWSIAFIFTFYVLSFFIDLLPAVTSKRHRFSETQMQQEANDPISNANTNYHEGRSTLDSQRTLMEGNNTRPIGADEEAAKPPAPQNF